MLKYLVWVPGFFWTFPLYIWVDYPVKDEVIEIHAVYTAFQICFLIAYFGGLFNYV